MSRPATKQNTGNLGTLAPRDDASFISPRGPMLIFLLASSMLLACPADRRPDESDAVLEEGAEQPTEERGEEPKGETEADSAEPDEAFGAERIDEAEETAGEGQVAAPSVPPRELVPGEGDLFGVLTTNHGTIVVRFLEDEAPQTVANFAGLATGQVRYENLETKEIEKGRFYDGLIFHRVIPGFMIQGGDPTGTGRGGPGYSFDDEQQQLAFDRPGLLAMANSGPDTNGSQFFITEQPTPHLTGRHTIFGTVEEGMEVVKAIARVPTGAMNRPQEPVVIESVEITRATEQPSP